MKVCVAARPCGHHRGSIADRAARAFPAWSPVDAETRVFSAFARRRSFHADARVWPRPAQYSGGRPGLSAGAAGWSQPGNLHVGRAVLLAAVVFLLVIGPPVIVAARAAGAFRIRIR
jgi:hypothetical protein